MTFTKTILIKGCDYMTINSETFELIYHKIEICLDSNHVMNVTNTPNELAVENLCLTRTGVDMRKSLLDFIDYFPEFIQKYKLIPINECFEPTLTCNLFALLRQLQDETGGFFQFEIK